MSLKIATIIAIVGSAISTAIALAWLFRLYRVFEFLQSGHLLTVCDLIWRTSLLIFFIVLLTKQRGGGRDGG